jgi:hypothetical protein
VHSCARGSGRPVRRSRIDACRHCASDEECCGKIADSEYPQGHSTYNPFFPFDPSLHLPTSITYCDYSAMPPQTLSTVEEYKKLVDSVEVFLLDCDGVIYHGPQVVPGVKEVLKYLRSIGGYPSSRPLGDRRGLTSQASGYCSSPTMPQSQGGCTSPRLTSSGLRSPRCVLSRTASLGHTSHNKEGLS